MRGRPIEIALGTRFGHLTVVELFKGQTREPGRHYLVRCECGTERPLRATYLIQGAKTCGCRRSLFAPGEAEERAALVGIWHGMIRRCTVPATIGYENYGGRGVIVCRRWLESFEAFLEDMAPRPSPRHSLDRHPDNDGNYEPGNVRWATRAEQARNKRTNRLITYQGETKCLMDWASELGMLHATLDGRLRRGWDVERALTTPLAKVGRFRRRVLDAEREEALRRRLAGESLKSIASALGVSDAWVAQICRAEGVHAPAEVPR